MSEKWNLSKLVEELNWKRRLSANEVGQIVRRAMMKKLNIIIPGIDTSVVDNYPQLVALVNTKLDNEKSKHANNLKSATTGKQFTKLDELGKTTGWSPIVKNIMDSLNNGNNKMYLFEPTKNVTKAGVEAGDIVCVDNNGVEELYESKNTGIDDYVKEMVRESVDDIPVEVEVNRKPEPAEAKPMKVTDKDKKDAIKIKALAGMIKEPSESEQHKALITQIAKDKSLMNLSKEQFHDYLKSNLGADAKDVDAITEAVVTKRAELLNKNQLKREQLTELDVGKLQEQSQRDFERKLSDQNLRYLLPAMLDKRDRLLTNRLNPELLKCGY